jgi:hypothetical protein
MGRWDSYCSYPNNMGNRWIQHDPTTWRKGQSPAAKGPIFPTDSFPKGSAARADLQLAKGWTPMEFLGFV